MKFLGLVWKSAWRKRIRTSLTVLSIVVAFVLFALLNALGEAFRTGGAMTGAERLIVIDRVTLINPLPYAYKARIAAVPGVASVVPQTWFGGYYQDTRQQFPQFPTEPDEYMDVYPEIELTDAEFDAWRKNRAGAVVGAVLAEQYGWSVGDRIPIHSTIYSIRDGGQVWEFDIEGIFTTSDPKGATNFMLFQHDYFREANTFGDGFVGWYTLRLEDGADPVEIANTIDYEFANSANETETSSEAAFASSFVKQLGNIGLIVQLILGAVFFTLLLVAGNTMSQSVRERISELAVLKTVGFSDRKVLGVVLGESIMIMVLGGAVGLLLGWLLTAAVAESMANFLPGVAITTETLVVALLLMLGAGVLAGIFPALKAMRLSIVDALARG